jgi:hypothetical protein
MKSLKEFLLENTDSFNKKTISDKIALKFGLVINVKLEFIDILNLEDSEGQFLQALYKDLNSDTAIGVNFNKDGEFISVYFWEQYTSSPYKADKEIIFDLGSNDDEFNKNLQKAITDFSKNKNNTNESLELTESIIQIPKTFTELNDKDNKTIESKLSRIRYADPEIVFENIETYTRMIANGDIISLMITGEGGVGKSHMVYETLKKQGLVKDKDWVLHKGHITDKALYMQLIKYNDKILVFDDIDDIFKSKVSFDILKAALDTSKERTITWLTGNTFDSTGLDNQEIRYVMNNSLKPVMPSTFNYTGSIIMISNLSKEDIDRKDRALLTRTVNVDVQFKEDDMLKLIQSNLENIKIYKKVNASGQTIEIGQNMELKREVLEFLKSPEFRRNSVSKINYRTFIKAYIFAYSGDKNWKRLAINS